MQNFKRNFEKSKNLRYNEEAIHEIIVQRGECT